MGSYTPNEQSYLAREVSKSLNISDSPTFRSASSSFSQPQRLGTITAAARGGQPKQLKPFATEDIKILLLENVNQTGQDILREQGYQVEFHKSSLPEDELIEKIR